MIDTGTRTIEVRNYIDGGWRDACFKRFGSSVDLHVVQRDAPSG